MRQVRRVLRALLAGAILWSAAAGCGDDPDPTPDAADVRATVEGDGRTFMPTSGSPDGTHLRFVDRSFERWENTWVSLYGDPDAEDPLAGDVVVVAYLVGDETRATIQEGSATWSWVRTDAPDDDQEVDQVAVGGRGPSPTELRDLLDRVVLGERFEADDELRPARLAPRDLGEARQLLAEGPIDISSVWSPTDSVLPAGTALQWQEGADSAIGIRVAAVEADPSTALLLRSMVDDDSGSVGRDVDVSFGAPVLVRPDWVEGEVFAATFVEDGLVVVVTGSGLDRDVVAAFVRDLRATDEQDWADLVHAAEEFPSGGTIGEVVLRGSFDRGRWAATHTSEATADFSIEAVDGSFGSSGTVGACASTSVGRFDGSSGWLAGGVSPAGTKQVTLQFDTGDAVDVATEELPDGAVVWGVYVEDEGQLVSVTAFGGDGIVLERVDGSTTDPFPPTDLAFAFCPESSD